MTAPLQTKSSEKVGQDPTSPYSDSRATNVEFEDYLHFAAIQRMAEDMVTVPESKLLKLEKSNWFNRLSEHKGPNVNVQVHDINNPIPPTADELERENASRALRLASWASVFYLITTDILGPFNAPFAISQVGWVPGTTFHPGPISQLSIHLTLFMKESSSTFSVCEYTSLERTWYDLLY